MPNVTQLPSRGAKIQTQASYQEPVFELLCYVTVGIIIIDVNVL